MTCLPPSIAPLPHLGVIRATGADAVPFLHGQLTQDIEHLAPGASAPAALCNPKGRVLASMHALRVGEEDLLLILAADVLDATLARLRRYVLRAKVQLADASTKWKLRGLLGKATETAAGTYIIPLPPADATPRALWVGGTDTADPACAPLDAAAWLLAEVQSGAARVGAATSGAFVPQMLCYESLGVLNFKKGCYPGQEIVARSQYRGAIKRRAFVAHTSGEAHAGDEVLDSAGNSAGIIAQAAPAPDGGCALIAVLALDAVQQPLAVRGAPLRDIHMPYKLLEI
ncbi:MAG: folate-binding protein YgfZ [Ottowia sp.]|nr:folate-binding protein YgfZ [Ottowia sp.]